MPSSSSRSNPRALADLGVHLLRTGDEPGARQALDAAFKIDPFNVVTYNLLQMMDTLDTFVTSKDGDLVLKMHKDEAPLLGEYAMSLGQQALTDVVEALRLHAAGADPHRGVSEARRLRGAQRRPARHDRRARRLLRHAW